MAISLGALRFPCDGIVSISVDPPTRAAVFKFVFFANASAEESRCLPVFHILFCSSAEKLNVGWDNTRLVIHNVSFFSTRTRADWLSQARPDQASV